MRSRTGSRTKGPHVERRGGARPGAGRPVTKDPPSEAHQARPIIDPAHPQHIVIRVLPAFGSLRRKATYQALRWATAVVATKHEAFRICHMSVQRSEVHLLVEADDRMVLARGMQGFQIAAARKLNDAVNKPVVATPKRGAPVAPRIKTGSRQVFLDRYRQTPITEPRQARQALLLVLNHWRLDPGKADGAADGAIDPFSTAALFEGWAAPPLDSKPHPPTAGGPLQVKPAQTWLLRQGWKRQGLLGVSEIPVPWTGLKAERPTRALNDGSAPTAVRGSVAAAPRSNARSPSKRG